MANIKVEFTITPTTEETQEGAQPTHVLIAGSISLERINEEKELLAAVIEEIGKVSAIIQVETEPKS